MVRSDNRGSGGGGERSTSRDRRGASSVLGGGMLKGQCHEIFELYFFH